MRNRSVAGVISIGVGHVLHAQPDVPCAGLIHRTELRLPRTPPSCASSGTPPLWVQSAMSYAQLQTHHSL